MIFEVTSVCPVIPTWQLILQVAFLICFFFVSAGIIVKSFRRK